MKKITALCLFIFSSHLIFGQVRLTDINDSNSSYPLALTVVNDKLYFSANNGVIGSEPYYLDSDDNLTFIGDLNSGGDGSFSSSFTSFEGATYFLGSSSGSNSDLWKLEDGVVDVIPAFGSEKSFELDPLEEITVYNDRLVFSMNSGGFDYGTEVYGYTGSGPINLLKNINPGVGGSFTEGYIKMGGNLYFSAITNSAGEELWVYKQSDNTFSMVADIYPGAMNGLSEAASSTTSRFVVFNDKLYFSARNETDGYQLFEYDGVNPPVQHVVNPEGDSYPGNFYVLNDNLFFRGRDSEGNQHLYKFDGVNPPAVFSDVLIPNGRYFNGKVMFVHNNGVTGDELWQFDGITPPSLVADINPGEAGSLSFTTFLVNNRYKVIHNTFYFPADDGLHGIELWQYNGINPPSLVADIKEGEDGSNPSYFANYNSTLYFTADDGVFGSEVWRLDEPTSKLSEVEITDVRIYPNPAHNIVNINSDFQIQELKIYSTAGNLVLDQTGNIQNVDVSWLEKGVYVFAIKTNNKMVHQRVVLK